MMKRLPDPLDPIQMARAIFEDQQEKEQRERLRSDPFEWAKQLVRDHHSEQGLPDPYPDEAEPLVCPECGRAALLVAERHARCAACHARLVVLR